MSSERRGPDISLLQRQRPHMQQSYLNKMARRNRNKGNGAFKTSSPKSPTRSYVLPKLRASGDDYSSRKRTAFNLVKPGQIPVNRSMNKTYAQTPFKAMKHYVQKNYEASINMPADPLMLDTSLDMDNNGPLENNKGFNKMTESLEGSLPSIQLNTIEQ